MSIQEDGDFRGVESGSIDKESLVDYILKFLKLQGEATLCQRQTQKTYQAVSEKGK